MAQRRGAGPPGDAAQQWIAARLAEAPPITPEQAASLSDLMVGARAVTPEAPDLAAVPVQRHER